MDLLLSSRNQQQILRLLIDNGAICDSPTLFNVSTWDDPSWEEFVLKMLENDANPFISDSRHSCLPIRSILNRADSTCPILKKIESLYPGTSQHLTNKLNLATLWEVEFFEQGGHYTGGNWVDNTYALLNQTYDALNESEFTEILQLLPVTSNEEQTKMLALLRQSVQYASQLLMRKDLVGIANEIREKSQQFPVILPTSGNGHATAIIFWKNIIIQANQGGSHVHIQGVSNGNPGVDFYEYDTSLLADARICAVIANPNVSKKYQINELKKGALIDFFAHNVDPNTKKILHVDTPGQRVGNCTWSSSALLAFQVAMEAVKADESPAKMVFSEEGKNFIEGFNTVARLLTVRNYLENIRLHQQDAHEVIESKGISKILRTCLVMLGEEDVKHPKLLEKIVSEILSSGLAIDCKDQHMYEDVRGMLTRKKKLAAPEACLSTSKQRFLSLLGLENYADAESLLEAAGDKEGVWHIA